ncbi:aldehyde ferredoxin oxidoreductase [Vulcanimicrobium alpinum]|uniref:Aldehyde ferredoxin oxidoreductase n=1 Tax=Vulcanimicrobium alpinum TaxID=3016050 RepID=A0AAN2C9S5_UNVUL|nr:aldehyde ferredoxin oxidoreductase family protein [Vulcanimicrobium alpinum]BDE06614.1 aldehyde ferredoxin oxidoreductase [Vulcanimicrobium alpinum]
MTYAGPRDLLEVDLSARSVRRTALGDEVFADALGGVGLAVRLTDERVRGRLDPLGPENPIVIAAGPFASTPVPAANKHALATISPLTGLLNEGLSSSHFSAVLRRCGLAAIVVTGASDAWTVLAIDGDDVRFEDASGLAGRSARETTKALRERYGDRSLRVCAIGPAGERGVRYAAVENDGRQAGRGGTGAVFGAKRLKAIALRGRGEVRIADPAATAALSNVLRERALGPTTAKYRVLGTSANLRVLQRMGQLPTRNFTAATFEGAENVTPERAREARGTYLELRAGCAGCPVQCEHLYVRKDRDRRAAAASEYESVWAFGPNCGVDDLDAVLDAIARCDAVGIDTISAGSAIAFAMECAQHGLVAADAFGPPLRFGNAAVLLPAIDAVAERRGLGDLLADGVRAAAQRIGKGAERFAMHCKGLELPGYEPRTLPTYALGLATCTRGACHNRAATYDRDLRDPSAERDDETRAADAIEAENRAMAWDSLVLCKFVRDCFDDFEREAAALWSAVAGLALDADGLSAAAQRTWERKRAINARLGWTSAEDTLPPRMFDEPVASGPNAGCRVDPQRLAALRDAYERLRVEAASHRHIAATA